MPLEMVTPPKALRAVGGAPPPAAAAPSSTYSEPTPFENVASSMVPPQKRPSGEHLPSFQRFFGGSAGAPPGSRDTAPVVKSRNARPVFSATSACSPPPPQNSGARSTTVPTCSGTANLRVAKVEWSRV